MKLELAEVKSICNTALDKINLDARLQNAAFNILNKRHKEILKEMMYDAGLPVETILEVCAKMTIAAKEMLSEGKFPDRQAWNREGTLITFEDAKRKQDAVRSGEYFDRNPRGGVPDKKRINMRKLLAPKTPKKLSARQLTPAKFANPPPSKLLPPVKYIPRTSPTPTSKKRHPLPAIGGAGKSPTPTVPRTIPKATHPTVRKAPPPTTTPSATGGDSPNNMWKFDPAKTYKKAKDMGWERDTCGNWWYQGKFVAMTTKTGFVLPVANGDKSESADWPEFGNIPLPPGAKIRPDQPGV